MPLSGPYIAGRYLAVIPNLQQVGLLSRLADETGYTAYAWTGRNFPSDQLAQLMVDTISSSRKKSIQIIRQAQVVMPKEQDVLYCKFGTSPGVWGLWNIKSLNSQFDMWVFSADTTWQRDITPLTALPTVLPAGVVGVAYSQSAASANGYGAITYTLTDTLPTGLALNAGTGLISGTPTVTGTFTFTITATDAGMLSINQIYSVVIT